MSRVYAKLRFREHRKGALNRKIDFNLTFEEWDHWWLSHGVDRNIPRHNNGLTLCMCRYQDQGAYELGNIYCATKSQNTKDAHLFNSKISKGHCKKIKTPIGIFESKIAASKALKIHTTTLSKWLIKDPANYFYI